MADSRYLSFYNNIKLRFDFCFFLRNAQLLVGLRAWIISFILVCLVFSYCLYFMTHFLHL